MGHDGGREGTRGREKGRRLRSKDAEAGEWDADVVVTTRREVADIPLSFIKEGFLSAFCVALSFTRAAAAAALFSGPPMFFPALRSVHLVPDTAAVHPYE